MRQPIRCLLAGLVCFGILTDASAQTIAVKKVNGVLNIEASATPENPGTLQVSHNMRLWVDVREGIQETVSVPLDNGGENERFYRLVPLAEPAEPIRVMILGDSMSADCCGWGVAMPNYFKENATIINYSEPWTSTKVFLNGPNYQRMMLVQPNYVFIAFAWSDGGPDPNTNASAEQFRANLTRIAGDIQSFNGVPILMTLHAPRYWENGVLDTWQHQYNWVIREVARDMNAPLLDLWAITRPMWLRLGEAGSAFFQWDPNAPNDYMHVSALGAHYFCRLLLREAPPGLTPYLKSIFDSPPPPP